MIINIHLLLLINKGEFIIDMQLKVRYLTNKNITKITNK